jgi:hypothetical protein
LLKCPSHQRAAGTKGAWYRGLRLVSIDGSTLEVADQGANDKAFGRPGASRGRSAFPQLRFVSLVENGTHVLFGTQLGAYASGEISLAKAVLSALGKGMLCLADRNFFGFQSWVQARSTGAELLWRVKTNARLPCEQPLADGSYLSRIYRSESDRRHQRNGVTVRVIEYRLQGLSDAEPIYRLLTSLLDPQGAPANELAALYHQRWEIETALAELKTHVRGAKIVLRSKTPELVRQEFYGLMMAHFAVRGLMHEAALKADIDPDEISFVHAVRVVRRKLTSSHAIPPRLREPFHEQVLEEILQDRVASSRGRRNPRGVKRKMSSFPLRPRHAKPLKSIDFTQAIKILKRRVLRLSSR